MKQLKYNSSDSAADPLMKCDDCKKFVAKEYIIINGGCNHCGNRRVKTIMTMESKDIEALKAGTYPLGIGEYVVDPAFFELFEEAKHADA